MTIDIRNHTLSLEVNHQIIIVHEHENKLITMGNGNRNIEKLAKELYRKVYRNV